MILLSVTFCLAVILGSSVSSTYATKPKPVDLNYSCMRVVAEGGNKSEVPIILIHGLFVSKDVWMGLYQLLALKTGRRICIVDLRNHGDSPQSTQTDVEAMSEDIGRLLDMINAPKAILLGHSLGGKIALHYALNYPSRVDKLIVEDMRPNGMTPKALLEIGAFMSLLQLSLLSIPKGASEKEAKDAVLKYVIEKAAKIHADEAMTDINPNFLPLTCSKGSCRWKSNIKLFLGIVTHPITFLTRSMGRFDGPALFVYGTSSSFRVNDDERNIHRLFPNAELFGVKGANHKIHHRPEFLNEVIKFINDSE